MKSRKSGKKNIFRYILINFSNNENKAKNRMKRKKKNVVDLHATIKIFEGLQKWLENFLDIFWDFLKFLGNKFLVILSRYKVFFLMF